MIKFTVVQKKPFGTWQFGKIGQFYQNCSAFFGSVFLVRWFRGNLKQKNPALMKTELLFSKLKDNNWYSYELDSTTVNCTPII